MLCYEFWGHNPIIQWFHSSACSTSFPTELIYSPKQFLPVTFHLHCRFPCFFFPLEIIAVTTHLTSDLLSSFLELFQPLFSAVSLSCHHLKVNEADCLLGENALRGLPSRENQDCPFPVFRAYLSFRSCELFGFPLVTLIKMIRLVFENYKIFRDFL